MTSAPARRAFIVGCPRSGTTLLQSLLGAHPAVFTLPETHFFDRVLMRRALQPAGLVRADAARVLPYLREAGVEFRVPRLGPLPDPTVRGWTRQFVAALDAAAAADGATTWVEKTPIHLRYVEAITRQLPDAQFVHMIRHGVSTVRSLVQVRRDNAATWNARAWDDQVSWCTRRWIDDVTLAATYAGREGHHFVEYGRLVADPPGVLGGLLRGLGLDASDTAVAAAVAARAETGARVSLPGETWKTRVTGSVDVTDRHAGVLDPAEEQAVRERVATCDDLLAALPWL